MADPARVAAARIAPVGLEEGIFTAEIDPEQVRRARHNFDPAGHYARPDVFRLEVDRTRQQPVWFSER